MQLTDIPEGGWVALITGAFAFLSLIVQQLFAAKTEVRKAKHEVQKANESVSQVETNTNDIARDMGIGVGQILAHSERMEQRLDHIERAVNNHLQHHLDENLKRRGHR